MKKPIGIAAISLILSIGAYSQPANATQKAPVSSEKAAAGDTSAADLAKLAFAAHGGDKLKKVTSLVFKGSVDLNVMNQVMPGAFSTAIAGDKYYFEINSAVQSIKQVYDGNRVYCSIDGFSLPPITSLGFPALLRLGDKGYVISEPGDPKKKGKGFRITTPEGYYTDFYLDDKTKQIKSYESSYEVGGRTVTTSVIVDELQTVDGVVVPKRYSQRFDLSQMTAYANFKTKQILVNSTIEDSAFALPR